MESPYNHTEWTIAQLDERLRNLSHFMLQMTHSDERKVQLEHEQACLQFELDSKVTEALGNGNTPAVG